jgi:phage tail-like protein
MPAEPYFTQRDAPLDEDPMLGFNFMLEIAGTVAGYFTECSGVGSEHEVVEHKVVDANGHESVRKIPGRLKWQDISLKRGMTSDLQIWQWRQTIIEGKVKDARKNVSITMLSRDYKPIAKWNFVNAWPSKVTGPNFKADDNSFGIEEVSIVHEGMHRDT